MEIIIKALVTLLKALFGSKGTPPKPPLQPGGELPVDPIEREPYRIGMEIVDVEARRDSNGHLKLYHLPSGDGGGSVEIAGLNDKYHPEILETLRKTAPKDREPIAAEYIENYARKGTGLTEPTGLRSGTLLSVLDSAFNRGPGGAAWIVQDALIRLGHDIARDRVWGPKTRHALRIEDQKGKKAIVTELRSSRERYEKEIVDPRHPAGSRDKFWPGLVNRWTKITNLSYQWNGKEPVLPEAPEKPRPPQPYPDTIFLPRETPNELNRVYGVASKSGAFNDWFSFPTDDVVLYHKGGDGLQDRDGDGRAEHKTHRLLVAPLEAALQEIYDTLGKSEYQRQGWNVYGGSFNYRYKTGGSSLSTHSWACAVDINPAENGWKQYSTTFSDEALDIMEKHGFLNAGRAWGHDFMHFQKAIPVVSKGSYYDRNGLPAHIKQL